MAEELNQAGAQDEEYRGLLEKAQMIKEEMTALQEQWRKTAVDESKKEEEGYGLWDNQETTLASLVMEYGASEYLYIDNPIAYIAIFPMLKCNSQNIIR